MFSIEPYKLVVLTVLAVVAFVAVAAAPLGTLPITRTTSVVNTDRQAGNTIAKLGGVLPAGVMSVAANEWAPQNEEERWCVDMLHQLEIVPQNQNVGACMAWMKAEGTYFAGNNPLNTTQEMPGNGCWNYLNGRCGVKTYLSRQDGLDATVMTLGYRGVGYEGIVEGLRANDAVRALTALANSQWGTGAGGLTTWNNEFSKIYG